ncbi:MAG: glycosyltransferase [Pseudomonadales bacterium]|nr:glycosyltransferase [Pseudomonadales bacterium]
MYLQKLVQLGWQCTVLCVRPEDVVHPIDQASLDSIPQEVEVRRVSAESKPIHRAVGARGLAFRALWPLYKEGLSILKRGEVDVVFFSTTEFLTTTLGYLWFRRFSVPYVVDYQDPWITSHYRETKTEPPGGHFRYGIHRTLARLLEPRVVKNAAHVIAVSPDYCAALARVHGVAPSNFTYLPIGASRAEFGGFSRDKPRDDVISIVCVGAVSTPMLPIISRFMEGLRTWLDGNPTQDVRVKFIGTRYDGSGEGLLFEHIRENDLSEIVSEVPARQSYSDALQSLVDADRILLFGSTEKGYHASRVAQAALSGTRIMALVHEQGSMAELLGELSGTDVLTYDDIGQLDLKSVVALIEEGVREKPPYTREVQEFDADSLAARLSEVLKKVAGPETHKRIIAMISSSELFGSERANIEVLRLFRSEGHEVVLCLNDAKDNQLLTPAKEADLEVITLPFGGQWSKKWLAKSPMYLWHQLRAVFQCSWAFRKLLDSRKVNFLYTGSYQPVSFLLPALIGRDIRMIYRMGDEPPGDSGFGLRLWQYVVSKTDVLVAISEFVRSSIRKYIDDRDRTLEVIYNYPPRRENLAVVETRHDHFLYVGAMSTHKGVFVLIDAIKKMCDLGIHVRLTMTGGSRHTLQIEQELRDIVRSEGLEDVVHLTGFKEDPFDLPGTSGLLVPSIWEEPLGNVVLEAKQRGIPAIVFPSGGLPEMIDHEIDGFVCREKSVDALVEGIQWLRKQDAASLQQNCLNNFDPKFGYTRFRSEWLSCLPQS